ncbi:MAG: carbohydrate kinase, partial [Mangrovicoccus sp.]|nr:carbohydrate kinase [Mangrovicoccus sp.]
GGHATALDPARDVLVNVNALGQPVPSARFMGGREFEILRDGIDAVPTAAERLAVLDRGVMILPAVEPGSGPFAGRAMRWTATPASDGERMAAIAHYLALMTDTCLALIGAAGPVVVEGPFARNPDFLDMLASLRPVEVAASATGTSAGAALLCAGRVAAPETRAIPVPATATALSSHARAWQSLTDQGSHRCG